MTDDAKSILDLSTQVEPAAVFTVDKTPYELRGISHLSPLEEAKLVAFAKREAGLRERLDSVDPEQDAELEGIANQLLNIRMDLFVLMTTMPKEVALTLPLMAQVQLAQAIQESTTAMAVNRGQRRARGRS